MNMFRDIAIGILVALGIGLTVSDPDDWKWVAAGGPYVVQAVSFLVTTKPFSVVICMALALALFMTRLKF